ncbi:aldose 1-epimerase [Microvirga sp. BSC39]|uniref:aldose 1-epimerase n=1 Tax=Microvirga sp. BSC39 TaxID=1549810 RepID=UPI00244DBD73|nr:aldose 1-epimerase [Microvirga sp. BSC39]
MLPELGAGLARFDLIDRGGKMPIFRSCDSPAFDRPFELACINLIPWSNRISGGGFTFQGTYFPLQPNVPNQPCAVHGNAFSSRWSVLEATKTSVVLTMTSFGPEPFRYHARLRYTLRHSAMQMYVSVTNLSRFRLPYGIGFHPWLPRTPDTLLKASAVSMWLPNEAMLPKQRVPVSMYPEWNFEGGARLPRGFISRWFDGWAGEATIAWPSRNVTLRCQASSELARFILYSPSEDAGFFCFEPVSHAVDAHNLPPNPEFHGLRILAPGAVMAASCTFTVERYQATDCPLS